MIVPYTAFSLIVNIAIGYIMLVKKAHEISDSDRAPIYFTVIFGIMFCQWFLTKRLRNED